MSPQKINLHNSVVYFFMELIGDFKPYRTDDDKLKWY